MNPHHCHWPGCAKEVPPKLWGCRAHWFALPKLLRDKIWRTYQPGQEITKTPSAAYIASALEAQTWIKANTIACGVCGCRIEKDARACDNCYSTDVDE